MFEYFSNQWIIYCKDNVHLNTLESTSSVFYEISLAYLITGLEEDIDEKKCIKACWSKETLRKSTYNI